MELTQNIKITEVKGNTRAKLFKDIEVNDVLSFKYDLTGGYKSAPMVDIECKEKGLKDTKYARSIALILKKHFEYVQGSNFN